MTSNTEGLRLNILSFLHDTEGEQTEVKSRLQHDNYRPNLGKKEDR